jgi:hypothetical protein
MATESFHPNSPTPERSDPARSALAVTPDNATDLSVVSRGLYIGTTGDISVIMAGNGQTVTFTAVPSGTLLPIAVSRVRSTGTTATNIVTVW